MSGEVSGLGLGLGATSGSGSESADPPAALVRELIALVAARAAQGDHRTVVGLSGAPGSGKSTLAELLVDGLVAADIPAVVLPMDGFHLPQAELVRLGRRDRMGAPDTFDVAAFSSTLGALRDPGRTVRAPGFDRTVEEPVADAITIGPEVRVVVVEGNYLHLGSDGWEAVAPLLDVRWHVDVAETLRQAWLIARHEAFGKDPAAARAWALGPDEANARLIAAAADAASAASIPGDPDPEPASRPTAHLRRVRPFDVGGGSGSA